MGEYLVAFVLGGIAGIVIGLIVGRTGNSNNGVVEKLKQELDAVKNKLKEQTEHFAESENMLHKIGGDLKELYNHMSKNEMSTLKEKFKGLVIDADSKLDELAHKAEDAKDDLVEQASELKDKVSEVVQDVKDDVKQSAEKADVAAEDVKEASEKVENDAVEVKDALEEKVDVAEEKINEKVESIKIKKMNAPINRVK